MSDFPSISVVVLNHNGRQHLADCFHSLQRLDYPRQKIELILVDNASNDGSIAFMTEHFPDARVIRNQSNLGFAKGNNIGAEAARGRYVAFLNNDTRVDEGWLREMIQPVLREKEVVCAASKILDWDGKTIDFVKGTVSYFGHGSHKDFRSKDVGGHAEEPILFACGGSMLVERIVFLESGGFDEDYFIYFEDVDLGWRLWIMGYRVMLVPTAVTYHRMHATMDRFQDHRKTVLYERNALYTIIKNYDQETLNRVLPAALLLVVKRMKEYMEIDGVDFASYHVTRGQTLTGLGQAVSKLSLAPLVALNELVDSFPALMRKREQIQKQRQRSDADIFELFGQPFLAAPPVTLENVACQHALAQEGGVTGLFESLPRRVLVVRSESWLSEDLVLGGDGSSAGNLCRALEDRGHEILLASSGQTGSDWMILSRDNSLMWTGESLMRLVERSSPDIVVACDAEVLRQLAGCPVPLVFYTRPGGRAASIPAEYLPDLSVDGALEDVIEPLDQFCRLPIMRRHTSNSKPKGAYQATVVHQMSIGKIFEEVWHHYRRGGVLVLINVTRRFLRHRLRR